MDPGAIGLICTMFARKCTQTPRSYRGYSSFQKRDSAGMAGCYHAEAFFEDPVFGRMPGWRASAMWRMFCEGDSDP
jgi:hypothetical protein